MTPPISPASRLALSAASQYELVGRLRRASSREAVRTPGPTYANLATLPTAIDLAVGIGPAAAD